ncbi:uncharacterized protein LOC118437799 isoform X3 [Folsomia candida]|uniref:uncharacterized protein LOC118437799 isoform X3 n=1 Tax=Folsomia candida TaxID=158441 RepID=UPI0016050077|nr:uncharacterized protein LOC118437799 isoform X3 [Folsomia candida]
MEGWERKDAKINDLDTPDGGKNDSPEVLYNEINCPTDENGLVPIETIGVDKTYYVAPQQLTFNECHRLCRGITSERGKQMHLAEFKDLVEQQNFSFMLLLQNCTDILRAELWIGGIALDYILSNAPVNVPAAGWSWIHSGRELSHKLAWNPFEPSRHLQLNLQYEACVTFRPRYDLWPQRHCLNDAHCSTRLPCVCQALL